MNKKVVKGIKLIDEIKLTDADDEDEEEEVVVEEKPVVAKKLDNVRKAPEGFIHWSEVDKEYPEFLTEYNGRDDVKVSIWIDENDGVKAILRSECRRQSTGSANKVVISNIPSRNPYTISVTDLFALMGAPQFHLEAPGIPDAVATDITEQYWHALRDDCLRGWRRDRSGRPEEVWDSKQNKEVIKGDSYAEGSYCAKSNDEYGLWDKLPNLYILTPDKLTMTSTSDMDIVDFTLEAMKENGISLMKDTYTDNERELIKQYLVSKSQEYKNEGLFVNDITTLAIVNASMMAAAVKYRSQR